MQEVLNGEDADAVKELLNIGIGRSAAMLNTITKSHIALSIPEVRVYNAKTLKTNYLCKIVIYFLFKYLLV